jgi:hypothetical protein
MGTKKLRSFHLEVRAVPSTWDKLIGISFGPWERQKQTFPRLLHARIAGKMYHTQAPKFFVRGTEYCVRRTDTKVKNDTATK